VATATPAPPVDQSAGPLGVVRITRKAVRVSGGVAPLLLVVLAALLVLPLVGSRLATHRGR
jgi:hypothetical protein